MSPRAPATVETRRAPGEPELWILIFGDMLVFLAFFVVIGLSHGTQPDQFRQSQQRLDHVSGLMNTLVLLTSSLFVALGLHAARAQRWAEAKRWIRGGWFWGLLFCVIKGLEYHAKIAEGVTVEGNPFFTLYFVMTGIHLGHVIIGMGVLWIMSKRCDPSAAATRGLAFLEGGSAYWHMVDLVWVILFLLLYLM